MIPKSWKAGWAGCFALALLAGCGGGGSGGSEGSSNDASVEMSFSLPYLLGSSGGGASSLQAGIHAFTADDVIRGVLLAVNSSTLQHYTFDWSVYLDEDTLEIQSNKTVILPPGRYDFFLLLIDGDHHYAGSTFLKQVRDGTNTIALVIRPVIGDVTTNVDVVAQLADFRFAYDPDELSGFVDPRIGIAVDGGGEEVFTVNPTTGLSEYMLLNLVPGPHHIALKFYEGDLQRGKSLSVQEDVTVSPGVGLEMDLVALQGEATFELATETGDATFRFRLPAELVDEAGGAAELRVAVTAAGSETGLHEGIAIVTPDGMDYLAEAVLPGFEFEEVAVALAFADLGDTPADLLGGCMYSVTLSSDPVTEICAITLRRRAMLGGHLAAVVGVNVFSEAWEPISGAIVSANGEDVGITGSASGFVKLILPAGSYALEARTLVRSGGISATFAPLGIYNRDIVLDTPIP